MVLLEEQYLTLELDVFALLRFTASENRISRAGPSSVWAARPGTSVSYPGAEGSSDATDSLPLAHYPWNQVSTLQLSLAGSVAG